MANVSDTVLIDMETFRQVVIDLGIDRPIAAAHIAGNHVHVTLTGNHGPEVRKWKIKDKTASPAVAAKRPARSKK